MVSGITVSPSAAEARSKWHLPVAIGAGPDLGTSPKFLCTLGRQILV